MIPVIWGPGFTTGAVSLQPGNLAPGQNHHSIPSMGSQASGVKSTEDLILVKCR
jgi:hypothetical protein